MQQTEAADRSDNDILELIHQSRDRYLKDFLDERYLLEYTSRRFEIRSISNIKLQFIKKEIKELLTAPLNLNHYERVIEEIKKHNDISLDLERGTLHQEQLDRILVKYIF